MESHRIAQPHRHGSVDVLEIEPSGLVRALGWSTAGPEMAAELLVDGERIEKIARYRTYRPELARKLGRAHVYQGAGVEWIARTSGTEVTSLELRVEGRAVLRLGARRWQIPAYDPLFTTPTILGRNAIYGFGPPTDEVADDVLALAVTLPGPVLDFGCGKGALVRQLRARGVDARGIEIDRLGVRSVLDAEMRDVVHLYDGGLPLPFADRSFASVTCIEVLEHCEGPAAIVTELARIARERCVVSVPDMSAIPICFQHRVVPWHLLESTHINFFTQASLEALLRQTFREVSMVRLGADAVNGTRFWTSLAAVCTR
jgi:2-polyprenyl-3-methyl-5-hydroxy-6-metoxy-1,4-benzoquinol methylase